MITWSRAVVVLSSLAAEDRRGLVIFVSVCLAISLPGLVESSPQKFIMRWLASRAMSKFVSVRAGLPKR